MSDTLEVIVYVIGGIGAVGWIYGFAAAIYYADGKWVDRRDA